MTFEELKAEAERQGYKLIKKKPYVRLKKCPICNRYPDLYVKNGLWIYECPKCKVAYKPGFTKSRAKAFWNKMIDGYLEVDEYAIK